MLQIKLILLPVEWHVTLRIRSVSREYYAATQMAIRQNLDLPKIEYTNSCFSVQATMSPVTDTACCFGQLAHSLWQATEAYAEIEVSVKDDLGEPIYQYVFRYPDYWFYSANPQPTLVNLALEVRTLDGDLAGLCGTLRDTFPWCWTPSRLDESSLVAIGRGSLPTSLLRFAEEIAQLAWSVCNGPAVITLSVNDATGGVRTSLSYGGSDYQAWLTTKRDAFRTVQACHVEGR